ncbi:hypothetical protein ID866_6309 [Astraeus odoratus]|nr:hypothetical protein ID866_6309 [Astraeus odoratus]
MAFQNYREMRLSVATGAAHLKR